VYTLKLALGFELFSGLLYLIFVLLICVISPEGLKIQWIQSPITAFIAGMGGVIVLNILIYSASRYFL
jgi:uncharacterized membrane protein YdcZ (DUF606 family)